MYIVSLNLLKSFSLITISVLLILGLLPGGTCSVGTAVPTEHVGTYRTCGGTCFVGTAVPTEHLPPGSKSNINSTLMVINDNNFNKDLLCTHTGN